ncbi:hypothetical protein CK203_113158 [Vitis vinifera]|uniref:Uncharacterized protein n=1 Tax=Vitis vinifera TaxID=29760 RepID=A0A438FE18_VITVI|nr:hypothetical protein CK203_113158 [Vitis vinifera]
MARTRGAQSSSPSSRKRAHKTPVQGSTSEPPRPPRVPPPEDAPMSPPVRRYQTRASSQPPKKKAKVSEPALIDLSEPEEPSSEPQPSQPPTDSQIPPAWLLSHFQTSARAQGLLPSAPEVSYGAFADS